MTEAVVRFERVTKRFSGHVAVRDLTLEVPRGIIGPLGLNGAGKSTTVRMIEDIIEPDEGKVGRFDGVSASLPVGAALPRHRNRGMVGGYRLLVREATRAFPNPNSCRAAAPRGR